MTLLDEPRPDSKDRSEEVDDEPRSEHPGHDDDVRPTRAADGTLIDPSGRLTFRGMRIRRVRLKSVAKISFVFWLLAYGIVLGTLVAIWNVAQTFGYVESFEETIMTSLGLDAFRIDGGGMFGVVAITAGVLCTLGWLFTVAMAAVYNSACGVLGGLAVETGPLQRRRRVFSWRHRGFVTVSE